MGNKKPQFITCFSDLHGIAYPTPPKNDILICAGDVCGYGSVSELAKFSNWYSSLPNRYKIFVAGNHDRCLEDGSGRPFLNENIIYLQDSGVEIEGLKIYGSPWTLEFNGWAFNLNEQGLAQKYDLIPNDTDVLITHGPAFGLLDITIDGRQEGSKSLALKIQSLNLRYHIFGHIHESYGIIKEKKYTVVNCSLLNHLYQPVNKPVRLKI